MKLKKGVDLAAFLRRVQHCDGSVLYISPEDDQLELRSQLGQYVFLAICSGNPSEPNGELRLQCESDKQALTEFLSNH